MMDHHMHMHGGGHDEPEGEEKDTTGGHGMLLFGDETLYMSHLPMFMHPHNFQVLLEVGFDEAVLEVLRADREANADGMQTFDPTKFPIAELDPSGDGPVRSSIEGTIYRGHFERGGEEITGLVTAEVLNVVHFAELDMQAQHSADRDLTYLCFGRAGELYLAHDITASPDFDHVVSAQLLPGTATDPSGRPVNGDATRDLDQAQPVRFGGRADIPKDRLSPGERAEGFFFATVGPTGSHGFGVQMEIGRQQYLELGELGSQA
jgi:hypothetical protein